MELYFNGKGKQHLNKLVKPNEEVKIYFTRCVSLNNDDHTLYNCNSIWR